VVGLAWVVVGVVVAVVVGVAVVAEDEFEVEEELEAAAVVGVETELVGLELVVAEEWAVVSEATRTPRPTARATAAIQTAPVVRRTFAIARSRARVAG
jgi:hypothetical protein